MLKVSFPFTNSFLSRIENGQKPSDHELQKLDILHDELVRYNMLDAMPNRAQSFLEVYQLEQNVKQDFSSDNLLKEILDKVIKSDSSIKLKPTEAIYLNVYVNKYGHSIKVELNRQIRYYLSTHHPDLYRTARSEFIDLIAVEEINKVITQIEEEQRPNNPGRKVYVPELNAYMEQTSNYMELRIDGVLLKKMGNTVINEWIKNPDTFLKETDKTVIKHHEGRDFSAHGAHSGTITYQYGFTSKPEIAKVIAIKDSETNKRATKDITIVEYHPDHGALLTTFYHVQKNDVSAGNELQQGDVMGTYMIVDENTTEAQETGSALAQKEHVHIERRYASPESLKENNITDLKNKLEKLNKDNIDVSIIKHKLDNTVKLTQPIIDGDEYSTIVLFSPGSMLNKQLLHDIQYRWLQDGATSEKVTTADDAIKYLKNSIYRDILLLETIIEMLLKLKLMLMEFKEPTSELEKTIQKAQKVVIDLREKYLPKEIKIWLDS